MKNLLVLFVSSLVVLLTSCDFLGREKQRQIEISDSLQHLIDLRDAEINDLLTTFNDVQESFNEINAAEDRIQLMRSGEKGSTSETVRENFRFIQDKMKQNKQMIENLQQQLRESTFKGEELKRALDGLIAQMKVKDKELNELANLLEERELKIAAQGAQIDEQTERIANQENTISEQNANISNLNTQVDEQKAENTRNQQTIATQDKELNTAWYAFGTKSELKEQNVLVSGKVLQGNFNKNYFKKIDIRTEKEIKLYSKYAQILTSHPTGTYTLQKDMSNQYVLKINNPQQFWATSKYLVIRVK
ncbi:MAG: hypothetical protein HUK08_09480 [Bacteroidaceae bacterium]|nr:hypothetical protein [Bacteroidaceae bacterium]